jgi:hypothetical protein
MADDEFKLQHLLGNSFERAKRLVRVFTDQNAGIWLNQLEDFSIETQTQNGYTAAELLGMLRKLNKKYAVVDPASLPFQKTRDNMSGSTREYAKGDDEGAQAAETGSATHVWG